MSAPKDKTLAFACDHRGFEVKNLIVDLLKKRGFAVIDCGTDSGDSADYPDHMFQAAEAIAAGRCDRAIGVCHSGIGSSIAANKVKGVRAALVHNITEAGLSRAHNDSNMLILGSGFLKIEAIPGIVEKWLDTPFEGGRHELRVGKIKEYEQSHAK